MDVWLIEAHMGKSFEGIGSTEFQKLRSKFDAPPARSCQANRQNTVWERTAQEHAGFPAQRHIAAWIESYDYEGRAAVEKMKQEVERLFAAIADEIDIQQKSLRRDEFCARRASASSGPEDDTSSHSVPHAQRHKKARVKTWGERIYGSFACR